MSLIKCKECKHEISKSAKKCPNCGAPNKARTSGCAWLFLIGIIVVVIGLVSSPGGSSTSSTSTVSNEPPTREEKIESGFSAWDGSHRALTRMIKNSMNDPKSYEHVETKYWDQGDHIVVLTKFRGKNAFGGTVINWVKAKCSLDGKVLEIIEQGP